MTNPNKVIPFESPGRLAPASAEELLAACQNLLARELSPLLKECLDQADDALFKLADKTDTNTLQTVYFDAMRGLRKQREAAQRTFQQQLRNALRPAIAATSARDGFSEFSFDDLQLVEEEHLEESLAVDGMVEKANARCHQELHALTQRLAHLLPERSVEGAGNPFGPAAISDAWRATVALLPVELDVRLVLYKLFDRHLMAHLNPVYAILNRRLIEGGILPQLRPVAPQRRGARHPANTAVGDGDLLQLLGEISVRAPGAAEAGQQTPGGATIVAPQQLLGALESLQQAANDGRPPGELRAALQTQLVALGTPQSGQMGRLDEAIIDVVSMLFEALLEDPNLSDGAKALLARLQIPLVRVALLDRSFLGDRNHPARRLVNDLARAAAGVDQEEERLGAPLYARIAAVVQQISDHFREDITLFERLGEEFAAFLAAQEAEAERARASAEAAHRERELEAQARRHVAAVVAGYLEGQEVPEPVAAFLRTSWSEVLLRAHLTPAAAASCWERRLELVPSLIWSVQDKETAEERHAVVAAIPQLLQGLREGLDVIDADPETVQRCIAAFEPYHLAVLRGSAGSRMSHGLEVQEMVLPTVNDVVLTDTWLSPAQEQEEDDFVAQARGLEVGAWVRFGNGEGKSRRLKLAWKSELLGEFTFVDWRFQVAAEESLETMAAALRKGIAIPVDDRSILERAIASVMGRFRGGEAAAQA